jgi:hypothetical protein
MTNAIDHPARLRRLARRSGIGYEASEWLPAAADEIERLQLQVQELEIDLAAEKSLRRIERQ